MRPTYESPTDLSNEQAVADLMAHRWRAEPVKLPIQFRVDYALFRNGWIAAWAEVKCRSNASDRYDTYMLSLAKVQAGNRLAAAHGVPFLLVVRWTDAIGWVQPTAGDVRIGGRRDRGDAQDIEQVVHIPITDFRAL